MTLVRPTYRRPVQIPRAGRTAPPLPPRSPHAYDCRRPGHHRRQQALRARHHRAPRPPPARRRHRHRLRGHLPLRHPPGPRGVGPGPLPDGARSRDRRHRPRGRLRGHASTRSATGSASAASWTPAASARTARPARSSTASRARSPTYNGKGYDGEPTFGGYSRGVVVDENYVLGIPEGIDLDVAAPLLCAGITLVLAAEALGRRAGQEGRHRRHGRPRPHGRQDRARPRRRGDRAQPDAVQAGGRHAARRRPLLRHQRHEDLRRTWPATST